MLTVVIPTLNEEERVAAAVRSAFEAGASEVIVVDGGSTDATVERSAAAGARVLVSEPMRAKQLNLGAQAAAHDKIIFLHADTLLPLGAAEAVLADFGGFRIAFAERSLRLRMAAFLINWRTRIIKQPWGDQAQFVDRRIFPGFREIPIMEDYDLARRMKRGKILPLTVVTSGRRFLQKGMLRTAFINWTTILRYHLGGDVDALARRYRK
jgi:rSAM/selenodomain-associated transferase 2